MQHYSVHLATRGPDNAPPPSLDAIEAFLDALDARTDITSSPVVSGGATNSYAATVDVTVPGIVDAPRVAHDAFVAAAAAAGLPDWPVTIIETHAYDELDDIA